MKEIVVPCEYEAAFEITEFRVSVLVAVLKLHNNVVMKDVRELQVGFEVESILLPFRVGNLIVK